MRPFAPVVPPNDPHLCEPWLNRELRRMGAHIKGQTAGLIAVGRGEAPDGSGTPILDLSKYFYLPGRIGGQEAFGGIGPGEDLIFSSTKSSTKGLIFLGSALGSAYDEVNNRLGIGSVAPETRLHVIGNPQLGIILANSDVTTPPGADPDWYVDGPSTYWQALQTDDGATGQVGFQQNAIGSQNFVVGLDSAIPAAVPTWTMKIMARRIGTIHASMAISVTMRRDDGQSSDAVALPSPASMSTSWTEYTLVFSAWGGATGQTPNSVRFDGSVSSNPGSAVINITYMEIISSSSGGPALTLFERTASSTLPYSIWRDENDVTVASITNTGAGQFQNVLLEDPGASAFTITHKAPTLSVSHELIWPAAIVDAGFLKVVTGGQLSWTTDPPPHMLLHATHHTDTVTQSPSAGSLIYSNATPKWDELPIGIATQLLQVNAGATAPAWVTLSGDASIAVGGALALTAIITADGPIGSTTTVPVISWDAKGRLTVVSSATIAHPDYSLVYQPLDAELTQIAGLARAQGALIVGGASAWIRLLTGTVGQVLGTDGTDLLWVTPSAGVGTHALLDSAIHTDTVTGGPGAAGGYVRSNGTAWARSVILAGDIPDISATYQPRDTDLDALAALAATVGMLARTGAGTFAVRTLTGTANEITVVTGDGSGTPTFSLPASLTFTGKIVTNGTFVTPTIAATGWTNANHTHAGTTTGGTIAISDTTGVLAAARGGTGQSVYVVGDLLYASTTTALSRLAAGTATQVLHGGTTPSWSALSLTADVTGVLAIANGGSNKALTLAAGGILWTDADSFEVLAAGVAGQILLAGGAATPTWSTALPTGALATRTGKAKVTGLADGTATTAFRSDADMLIDETIEPTWTAMHTFLADASTVPIKLSRFGSPSALNLIEYYDDAGNQLAVLTERGRWHCNNGFVVGANPVTISAPSITDPRNQKLMDLDGSILLTGGGSDPPISGEMAVVNRSGSRVVTANASSNVLTTAGQHLLAVNATVTFTNSGGALPGGISVATVYYVISIPTSNTFTISTTLGGSELNFGPTNGTGTHTVLTGNIINVKLTNDTPAGFYLITAYLSCEVIGDGFPVLRVTWPDAFITQTDQPVTTLDMSVVGGYASGSLICYLDSGDITWKTTEYGTYGSYRVKIRCLYLGT